ncbi:MAG: tetratricopeptide repeat protein [Bacteroidota bacterium]|nr:tetratricopeptide repeat protein [Bacteroidota bacterium]
MSRRVSFIIFFFCTFGLNAQIDSLKLLLKNAPHDSLKANYALIIAKQYYQNEGLLDSSLSYYEKAALYYSKNNVMIKLARALNGKALIYREKGIYKESMDNCLKALSIAENYKDTAQITNSFNNIAIVNAIQKDYDKAFEYYKKCEAIHLKTGSTSGLAATYNNLGLLFSEKNDPDRSLEYFQKALVLNEKNNDVRGIATNCENIGLHYLGYEKETGKALANFKRSIALWRGMKDVNSIAITLDYIASALIEEKEYKKALDTVKLSLILAKKAGSTYSVKQSHEKLYLIYDKMGDGGNAFIHYKEFINLRDSLKNDDKSREITQMQMTYEFDKQREVESLRQELMQKNLSDKISKQNTIIYSFIITLGIFSVFSFLIYRSYRLNKSARKKITYQNGLLAEQNKNIVDSIKYAKHIQEAILPPVDLMKKFIPDHFILYKPKDIVSGDFYWLKEKNNKVYFAVVDCTGHGVPGAFMSIVGANGLTEALNFFEDPGAADMLNFLNKHVNTTLNQREEYSTIRDGMDLSICVFDKKNQSIDFAGANNPVWIINPKRQSWPESSSFFHEMGAILQPDKQPIGNFVGEEVAAFSSIRFQSEKNDTLYFFTDGFSDQFGGEKGKKFKYKQLQKILLQINEQPMQAQCDYLDQTFENWKGSLEQVDDVCIIGVRL